MEKQCLVCGKSFYKSKNDSIEYWNKKLYCSLRCFGISKKGIALTDNHKNKISISLKGKTPKNLSTIQQMLRTEKWRSGTSATLMGHSVSKETRNRISAINVGKHNSSQTEFKKGILLGASHPRWKGGRINYLKRQARIRDDYTCQICGLRDIEITEIDHIKSKKDYPDLFHDINNLITLCPNCHRRKHIREKIKIMELTF